MSPLPRLLWMSLWMSLTCLLLACGAGASLDEEGSDSPHTTPGDSISGTPPSNGGPGACITVVQYARPSAGGACRLFSTPCAVPQDFVPCCAGPGLGSCLGPTQCVDDPLDSCVGSGCQGICQPLP